MKKIFYFVRHGESILNSKGIRQGPNGSLSDQGIEQANITGRRLQNIPFDIMLVSPYQRTKETGEIIQEYVKKPIEFLDLIVERRNPSEIVGQSMMDPEIKKIVGMMDGSFHDDNFRYSDEENFADLKARAKDALEAISKRKEKKILVVTHGIFLKMLVAYIVVGDKLDASAYNTMSFLNTSGNASITVCEYKTGLFVSKVDKGWKLIVWDDSYNGMKR